MKKTLILGLLISCFIDLQAQEIFFHNGKNLTAYDFKDYTHTNVDLQNGIGFNYEVGYISTKRKDNPIFYSLSAVINEYNATGSTTGALMEWKTNYLGLKGSVYYSAYQTKYGNLALRLGLATETIVYGRQKINFDETDIVNHEEFSGVFAGPTVGILYSYMVNTNFALQLGYNYDKHFSLSNKNQEKLSFNNHSLNIGFSVKLD